MNYEKGCTLSISIDGLSVGPGVSPGVFLSVLNTYSSHLNVL